MNNAMKIKTMAQVKRDRLLALATNITAWAILIPVAVGVTYLTMIIMVAVLAN